jgi:hypothetical protein
LIDSVEEQREHFRLDWHRCNVKRKLEKKSPMSEAEFEKMLEDAGSILFYFHSTPFDSVCFLFFFWRETDFLIIKKIKKFYFK